MSGLDPQWSEEDHERMAEVVNEAAEVADMLTPPLRMLPVANWEDDVPRYAAWAVPVTSINAPVLVVDRSGTVVDANDWFSARLGYTRSEVVGSPLARLLPPEVIETHAVLLEGWFAAGDAQVRGEVGPLTERRYSLGGMGVRIKTAHGDFLLCEVSLHSSPRNRYAAAIVTPLENLSTRAQLRNRVLGVLAVLVFCMGLTAAPTYLNEAEELRLLGIGILAFLARDVVPGFLSWASGRGTPESEGRLKSDATKARP